LEQVSADGGSWNSSINGRIVTVWFSDWIGQGQPFLDSSVRASEIDVPTRNTLLTGQKSAEVFKRWHSVPVGNFSSVVLSLFLRCEEPSCQVVLTIQSIIFLLREQP
jgi:hypothetical protein